MSDWPLGGAGGPIYNYNGNCSCTSNNTKGNWFELIASAPCDGVLWLTLQLSGNNGNKSLVDIGVGAAGSEAVLVSNIHINNGTPHQLYQNIFLPILIQKGQRVAVRHQSSSSTQWVDISAMLQASTFLFNGAAGFTRSATYGAATATSRGTSYDPGGTINTKGGWVDLIASAPFDIKCIIDLLFRVK